MKEKLEKYAELLLTKGVSIKPGTPLLISAPMEAYEFVEILSKKAFEKGVTDIGYDLIDEKIKHDALKYLEINDLKESPIFNKKIFDEYAKKDAAFLMLMSDDPTLMDDIDSNKLSQAAIFSRKSKPLYKQRQLNNEIVWCIACTATKGRAEKMFDNTEDAINKLWDAIFDACYINNKNPNEAWDTFIEETNKKTEILNKLKIKELHYTNNLGTNLIINLLETSIWNGASEKTKSGVEFIANIPTQEVFTTPNRLGTNGIVYSSKPLIYNGGFINDFFIEFKDGKVINYDAKEGKDILKGIIESDENACYLGEVALVDYNSPISTSKLIHYETLYDENASCHLALGSGFTECVKGTDNKSKEELISLGFNYSDNHVDFMIGTEDLNIMAKTFDGKEVQIFKDGNFYC